MLNSKFKTKKLVKLILEVFFYGVLGLVIAYILNMNTINLKTVIKSILPCTFRLYWFFTIYIITYILSPFINKVINVFNKIELQKMLLILLFIQVIIPTFTTATFGFSEVG